MSLRRLRQNMAGDTIIEVMIVLAVLGLAISISYATANRSLLNTRQAQENSEATKVLQTQIEQLRILAANGPNDPASTALNPFTHGSPFCVTGGASPVLTDETDALCTSNSGRYTVKIYYCPGSGDLECAGSELQADGTFLITAKWDNVRGIGKDSINYVYRYYGKWD